MSKKTPRESKYLGEKIYVRALSIDDCRLVFACSRIVGYCVNTNTQKNAFFSQGHDIN